MKQDYTTFLVLVTVNNTTQAIGIKNYLERELDFDAVILCATCLPGEKEKIFIHNNNGYTKKGMERLIQSIQDELHFDSQQIIEIKPI